MRRKSQNEGSGNRDEEEKMRNDEKLNQVRVRTYN